MLSLAELIKNTVAMAVEMRKITGSIKILETLLETPITVYGKTTEY